MATESLRRSDAAPTLREAGLTFTKVRRRRIFCLQIERSVKQSHSFFLFFKHHHVKQAQPANIRIKKQIL